MNGDGYIGGEGKYLYILNAPLLDCCFFFVLGYLSMLERATGRDINGDGVLGRLPDVVPGYPAAYGHPSMVYGPGGRVVPTNGFVRPHYRTHY
jgi:hypothetical protein